MVKNKSYLFLSALITFLFYLATFAINQPVVIAQVKTVPTPTPRSLFSSGIVSNIMRTASLGGPGGGGEVRTQLVVGTCGTQENISIETENRWAINQSMVYINDEAMNPQRGIGYALPYSDLSVTYCGNDLDLDRAFVTLITPNHQNIALRPVDINRFEFTFMTFHATGNYLLNIRNGDFEPIQHVIEVVRVQDSYQGFRLSITNPSTGKQIAWIQRDEPLHINYYLPTNTQTVEASLYPPLLLASDELEHSDYWDPSELFRASGGDGGRGGLFIPFDLEASQIWNVKTNQTGIYSETLIFSKNSPLGMYFLMAGESRSQSNNVEHLEPVDASGNLIEALGSRSSETYGTDPLGTDYLYRIAVINFEPRAYKLSQSIPVSYVNAYGAKYAGFILDVPETVVLRTGDYPIEVVLSSHGAHIHWFGKFYEEQKANLILFGPERYLILLSESTNETLSTFNAQTLTINQFSSELVQKGKQAFRGGELDSAIEYWRQAVTLNPASAQVHNLLCWAKGLGGREAIYSMIGYEEVEAIEDCYKAVVQGTITSDPLLPFYYDSRGVVYAQMGKLEEAIIDFERYLAKYPNDARRRSWIAELRAGRNPFFSTDNTLNENLLQKLREEPI